jgi:hypothetical protein
MKKDNLIGAGVPVADQHRVNLTVSKDLYTALLAISRHTGETTSGVIRRALVDLVKTTNLKGQKP